jgi:hypothetical protein
MDPIVFEQRQAVFKLIEDFKDSLWTQLSSSNIVSPESEGHIAMSLEASVFIFQAVNAISLVSLLTLTNFETSIAAFKCSNRTI